MLNPSTPASPARLSASASCGTPSRASRRAVAIACALLFAHAPATLGAQPAAGVAAPQQDEWLRRPVDDRTFATFLSFFSYDHKLPFDVQVLDGSDSAGMSREHLSFQSTPGVKVFARLYQPLPLKAGRQPAIIFLHGGSAGGKDAASNRALAEYMAQAGWRVLAIDYQYFGERKTDLLTTFTEDDKHAKLYNQPAAFLSWVTQTVKDVGRAYDFLADRRNTDPKRIALVGFSRGAQMALIVGGAEKRIAAVAALYAGHFDRREDGHHPAACPANYIGRISPRPLFLMNGTNDEDYNRELTVEPLHKLAKHPVQVTWLETGHTLPPEDQRGGLTRWLQHVLK